MDRAGRHYGSLLPMCYADDDDDDDEKAFEKSRVLDSLTEDVLYTKTRPTAPWRMSIK